jgi:hypothetical protein
MCMHQAEVDRFFDHLYLRAPQTLMLALRIVLKCLCMLVKRDAIPIHEHTGVYCSIGIVCALLCEHESAVPWAKNIRLSCCL